MQMHTRTFFRAVGLALAALIVTRSACTLAAETRPNIIFIFTDDQRFDALGAVHETIKTPNLDRLAARGTRFANAFVTLSICSPSRAAVMTGQYGSVNGVTTLGRRIADPSPLVPKLLRDAGYHTGIYGKWHLRNAPAELGFEEANYFHSNGTFYGRKAIVDGETATVPGYIDQAVADWSVAFIQRAKADGRPFFLWHCTQVPHMDHTFDWPAREVYLDLYDAAKMPLPATWQDDLSGKPLYLKTARSRLRALEYGYDDPAKIRRHLQRYRAAVTQVDATLGRVLDAVDRLGLAENTWFVFAGDNGWQIGEHGFTSKVLAYEESIRVPMILAGPGTTPRVDQRLALNVDLAATILDVAGIEIPGTMHGRSLRAPASDWRDAFVYEAPTPVLGAHPIMALRDARWKLIRTYDPKNVGRVAFTELYDLENDPNEMHNLAGEPARADRIARMGRRIAEHRRAKRPVVHFENRWDEPVAVYWIAEEGPRKQVGFLAPGGRFAPSTTLGHRFLLEGVRTGSRGQFTVREPGQTFVLDPKARSAMPGKGRDDAAGTDPRDVSPPKPPVFEVTAPPAELQVDPVYKKFTSAGGYPIVASANVSDYALKEAAYLIGMMMAKRPDVLEMMIASGSRMCILGYNEYTTELPEFAHFKPKDYWDARARGTGGSRDDPYCSCGEENLLGYPGDPYAAECILIHEFAHNIHLRGLVHLDPTFDDRLKKAYEAAMEKGLWKGKYAGVNHHEYFAEGVQSWFDNNRPPDHDHNHVDTRRELIEYDPGLAAICREVFGETELKYTKPATRLRGHLEGYDPSDAPTFAWPERLNDAREKIRRDIRRRNPDKTAGSTGADCRRLDAEGLVWREAGNR